MNLIKRLAVITVGALLSEPIGGVPLPVFPGAEGFGVTTPAGRGGRILRVTNLNDSGPGSLRAAIDSAGPRIVIFEVSGTIALSSKLDLDDPYITIAGQTAPSPGITLKASNSFFGDGDGLIAIKTHDVLIQHLRLRTGDLGPSGSQPDALSIGQSNADVHNVVIDHCSFSWAVDENLSTWYGSHDITISNAIVSEALQNSDHPEGPHSKGFLMGDNTKRVALLRSLFAHNFDRNPFIKGGATAVVANNVFYNIGQPFGARTGSSGSPWPLDASLVGNAWLRGVNTPDPAYAISVSGDTLPGSRLYLSDNLATELSPYQNSAAFDPLVAGPPVWAEPLALMPSGTVEAHVLSNAGARPTDRDAVDQRIVSEVQTRAGRVIDSQDQVGGWPELAQNTRPLAVPANPHADDDGDGYTNVEEWLHQFAAQVEGVIRVPADYPTIQAAINAAQPGATILVSPGRYPESLTLDKGVVLRAEQYEPLNPRNNTAIIDGGGAGAVITIPSGVGFWPRITGFTIFNASDDGIASRSPFIVEYCHFTGAKDLIDFASGSGGIIRNNIFEDAGDDGLDLDNQIRDLLIENNQIINSSQDGIEIRLHDDTIPQQITVTIRNNRIQDSGQDGIQFIDYYQDTNRVFVVERNLFLNNKLAALGMMDNAETNEDLRAANIRERIHVFNNTFVGNDHGISGGDNLIALNNILVNTVRLALKNVDANSIAAYNLFSNNGADNQASNVDLGTTRFADPLLDVNYQLQSASPGIDAGTAFFEWNGQVVLNLSSSSYARAAPDLGRVEFEGPLLPSAPGNLAATAVLGSQIDLSWTDNSDNESGFRIERSTDGINFAEINTVGSGLSTYSDAGLPSPATYSYRVTAYNDNGNSAYSNSASAALVPAPGQIVIAQHRISAGTDDAEERSDTGSVSLTSSDLELVCDGKDQIVGMRFVSVDIPRDATILSASVQFQVDEISSESTSLTIHGHVADNALTFSSSSRNISARPRTAAAVAWSPATWTTVGQAASDQKTPDLAPVIQEIVSRPGWVGGNSLAIIVTGSGRRVAEAYDGDPLGAPLLVVKYEVPGLPIINSFTPTSGPAGTEVTLTGGNFTGTTAVAFSGTPAASFTVDLDTQIRATVPGGATSGPISVTNAAGASASAGSFTVTAATVHDVGVTQVSAPSPVQVNQQQAVVVTVANEGTVPETFTVSLTDGLEPGFSASQPVTLGTGASQEVSFDWTPTVAGEHPLTATASTVSGETDIADNSASVSLTVTAAAVHDIAVTQVTAPLPVEVNQQQTVTVTVNNQGTVQETFAVSIADGLEPSFSASQTVTLAAGVSQTVSFTWTPTVTGTHALTGTATLAGDSDTTDNSKSTMSDVIAATVHDVAVISVGAPSSVEVNRQQTVVVMVANQGNAPESFAVSLTDNLAAGISGSQTLTLAEGASQSLSFTWTPAVTGTHTLTATASTVSGETDTADNSRSASSKVRRWRR